MSFAKEVWGTLSKIDVSNHIEKKMNLSYLSWAWAWGELMNNYPESMYEVHEPVVYGNGTCEVKVTLTISKGDQGIKREMWLPVMDHRNKAIVNPDSRAVSDSRMRCLVKCIAMFGLGHYIYAGEDLPQAIEPPKDYAGDGTGLQPASEEELNILTNMYQQEDALGLWCMNQRTPMEVWGTLRGGLGNRMGKGNKTKGMKKLDELLELGDNKVAAFTEEMKKFIANDDQVGIEELKELPVEAKKVISASLSEEEKASLR